METVLVGAGVLSPVIMKNFLFWATSPRGPVKSAISSAFDLFHNDFLLGALFDPKFGNDMNVRKVGRLSPNYTELYEGTHNSAFANSENSRIAD
jgi:hypothetical protein